MYEKPKITQKEGKKAFAFFLLHFRGPSGRESVIPVVAFEDKAKELAAVEEFPCQIAVQGRLDFSINASLRLVVEEILWPNSSISSFATYDDPSAPPVGELEDVKG